ncbi:hypothetical protein E3N88_23043 [Mikania micrantha]|uniref:Uncharacterized protein n=1 Tax=Mikania micrantha TaxID=192012 RepID=A0A5N6NC73_9ASTR|nr:hypothetical protein E3N88_23043 [Mikania micrantha]
MVHSAIGHSACSHSTLGLSAHGHSTMLSSLSAAPVLVNLGKVGIEATIEKPEEAEGEMLEEVPWEKVGKAEIEEVTTKGEVIGVDKREAEEEKGSAISGKVEVTVTNGEEAKVVTMS